MRAVLPFVLAILLGLWAHAPNLACPYAVDDYAQHAMLDGTWPLRRAPWDLYNFVDGSEAEVRALTSAGALPWWSHPRLEFRFLRPLSSALIALDHRAFGARGSHLHSLAWWLACCVGLSLLARKTLQPRAAPIAVALFAADGSHTLPLGWIANRNVLVTTALGLFALWRYHCFREEKRWRDGVVSGALFALALAGGEYALTIVAYAVAHTLVVKDSARGRAIGALPWLAPVALWLLAYKLGGYGTNHSDAYLDPFRRTGAFVIEAPARLFAQMGDLWFAVPAEGPPPWGWSAMRARGVGALGLVAIAAALYAMRPVPPSLRWFALGSVLAIVPVLPAFGTSRLQAGAQVGVAAVLATLIVRTLEALARKDERRRITPWIALLPALSAAALHLWITPSRARQSAAQMCHGHARELATLRAPTIDREGLAQSRVVLVAAPDGQVLLYTPYIWSRANIPMPRAWLGLTATAGIYRLRRPEPDVLWLEALTGPWLAHQPEAMFRASASRLREGDRVSLDGVEITVTTLRVPGLRRVAFRFREPLDGRATRLMVLDAQQGLREVPFPPVGGGWFVPEPRIPERPAGL